MMATSTDAFARHNVDRLVPVEALMKCKMQDNLEFLQWIKRYWDQFFPGGEYDAMARRKAAGVVGAGPAAAAPRVSMTTANNAARRAAPVSGGPARTRTPLGGGGGQASSALTQENNLLKETVAGLERERDFYFSKLRDIELLIQQAVDADPDLDKEEGNIFKQIQTILYSTEVSD
jgi:microtubule-associated protein, RP/EB family